MTASSTLSPHPESAAKAAGRYADVNGIRLYYEIHGEGRPLVLLHGGLCCLDNFGPTLDALAEGHKVIAVDMQGHGRTADIDRPITTEYMADDIAALLLHLDIWKADFVGYSLGGGVALQVAVRHPEVVDRLVMASTALRRTAFYPDLLAQQAMVNAGMADMMKNTPMYQQYQAIAPRPEDFPQLLDKIGETMRKDFDYSKDLAAVKSPTLIVVGDSDMFPPSHAVEMFELLGGGQKDGGWDGSGRGQNRLAILPGVTHYTMDNEPGLVAVTIPFLDEGR